MNKCKKKKREKNPNEGKKIPTIMERKVKDTKIERERQREVVRC